MATGYVGMGRVRAAQGCASSRTREREQAARCRGVRFSFAMSRFQDSDLVSNTHLIARDDINLPLAQYNVWLRRFFVCVTDEINPIVAQVLFNPHSDRPQKGCM